MTRFRSSFVSAVVATAIFAGCQPPRAPVITRSLPIEGKPEAPPVRAPANNLVRIGVRVEVAKATIGCTGVMDATNLVTEKKETWPPGQYAFTASNGELLLDGKSVGKKWRIQPEDPAKFMEIGEKPYRGRLAVRVTKDDKLIVVNELSIDDYLKGVLPREVVVSWPDQALRVQAVASRTYLASHMGSHAQQGFDLCSDVHCQVYGGMGKEHPKSNEAVDATSDQIIVYEGRPIGAYFHSNCGGSTEQIGPVWGQANLPYLPRKKCGYGTADPRYHWKISLSAPYILGNLRSKTKVKGDSLKSVRIGKKSPSGRAQTMIVATDKGKFELSGNEFRIALDPEKIRSTLFTSLERHGDGYSFAGRGWGHGVGMCQWGAKGQAELGKDYRDILSFYYPHTEIRKWSR